MTVVLNFRTFATAKIHNFQVENPIE